MRIKTILCCSGAAVLLSLLTLACSSEAETGSTLPGDLPQVHPEEITSFESVGDFYFQHLGYRSIPLEDGTFLMHDRMGIFLLQVGPEGELVRQISREGKGPGEIGDIIHLTATPEGEILLVDQGNQRVMRFDAGLEIADTFLPEPMESRIRYIYPAEGENRYIAVFTPQDYMRDESKRPRMVLAPYDRETGRYADSIHVNTRNFAPYLLNGELFVGGREVAYAPDQLLVNNPSSHTLFAYWTDSGVIAELDSGFDTLRTVTIDLPSEPVSQAERDSLREENPADQWDTLGEMLPEQKTPVEEMLVDRQGRFWLQLNRSGPTQQWLVVGGDGEMQKVVHLPKGVILSHVSEHHLGVRSSDGVFTLYRPVD